ncbi:MAG: class I tRNA ligase family protein, partial [Patescibacteria group bacterium]
MAYDHKEIEKLAREKWAVLDLYKIDLSAGEEERYYLLVEFPYPSGDLHIGHWYAFAVTDMYARMLRAKGKNVFFPIGFDAFGLPAENAAIKNGADPKEWTYKNIERMRGQLATMGASFDWSKEVVTCEPSYYQWTQWLFAKLFEHGLAERREAAVKWCPKDQTVLANEQVVDGVCERCGTPVEEKRLTQWFLKITNYADKLLTGLDTLPWREEIKEAQRAWIGKSEGAKLRFSTRFNLVPNDGVDIEVFTTRPDTVFGATYIVLAPEHALVKNLIEGRLASLTNAGEIEKYVEATKKKTEKERSENKEKTGVKLKGVSAINPATKEEIPIFIADYVLGSYGTGAIMAVPAHDERDREFAEKFNLPILEREFANWDTISGIGGERTTQYRIRDWLVSRQRYWGCPIPIVYDPEGKPHAIPAEHLPWLLPTDVDFKPTGKAPLASSQELKDRVTKIFGEGWTPEYDTLDTFVDSSWYFLRYLDTKNTNNFSSAELMKKWLPINRYSGGSEHTTMHLLYARFFMKALYDLALVPVDEPFNERFNRGLIMGPDGAKMSKSKGNVVNPDEFVEKYGADAVRIYLAFIGPYNEPRSCPWSMEGVASMRKFLDRVARMVELAKNQSDPDAFKYFMKSNLFVSITRTLKKVTDDGNRFKFNTGVAALMALLNEFEDSQNKNIVEHNGACMFIIMLAPFAPHLAEHLWEELGNHGSVHQQSWPTGAIIASSEVEVVVQVAGRRRGSIRLPSETGEAEALAEALKIPAVSAALAGKEPKRII